MEFIKINPLYMDQLNFNRKFN
jgi:hypothetical protein